MILSPTKRLAGLMLLPLAGCAGTVTSYPSLAPRAVEQGGSSPDAVTTPPLSLDPAVGTRAAALVAQAQRGEKAMVEAARASCAAIARGVGASDGGEAWIAAQQGLSAVEAARQDTAAARDDIDALVLEQARLAEDQSRGRDLSPLLAAADTINAVDSAQEVRLATLRAGRCAG